MGGHAGRVAGAKARIRVPAGAGRIGSLPEQMTLRGASSAGADRDPSGAARIAQTEVLRSRPEGGALRLSASARPPLSGALACSAATAFAVVPVVFGSAQGGRVYAFVFACFFAENRFPLFRKHSLSIVLPIGKPVSTFPEALSSRRVPMLKWRIRERACARACGRRLSKTRKTGDRAQRALREGCYPVRARR